MLLYLTGLVVSATMFSFFLKILTAHGIYTCLTFNKRFTRIFIPASYKNSPLVQIYPPSSLTCFLCVADFQWLAKKVFFDGSLYFFVTYTMISPCDTFIKRTTVLSNTEKLPKCVSQRKYIL